MHLWVRYFTPGWQWEAIRFIRDRQQAAKWLVQELNERGITAAVINPLSVRLPDLVSLLELYVRSKQRDAATDAIAAVQAAAVEIGLIVWELEAHTDPQDLAA